jgi:tRNA (adenine37-N6)-methyltransferase
LHTPFKTLEGIPIQPAGAKGIQGNLELYPEYQEGLKDLEGFSHIIILFHFHKVKTVKLQAKSFLDTQLRGIFAIRGPPRPNPIGLSIVKLVKIDENNLILENVDMLDGTPVLDIKPYIPKFDSIEGAKAGWIELKQQEVEHARSDNRFS